MTAQQILREDAPEIEMNESYHSSQVEHDIQYDQHFKKIN